MQRSSCLRRSQQKVQLASRLEINRDSECDEQKVVQGVPEDRQDHSRNHVEEECETEPNKREHGTSHDDVYDAPQYTNKHCTSWRCDLVSPWRLDHPCGVPPGHRRYTGAVTVEGRGWLNVTSTRCEAPKHGSGAEKRTAALSDRVQACINSHHFTKARTTTAVLLVIVGERSIGDAIKTRDVGSRTSLT